MHPMTHEWSNACPFTETPPFSQHRRQYSGATRLISTLSAHRRERRSNAFLGPVQSQSVFTRQAACNGSTRTTGARGGGCAVSPRCVRMRWMTAGSSMAAMSFNGPPQCGQCSMSMSNARFNNYALGSNNCALESGLATSQLQDNCYIARLDPVVA